MKTFCKIIPFVALFALFFSHQAGAQEKKNVLILNSYHQGFKWTDDITRGVVSVLENADGETRIFIEYMGTKWVKDRPYFQELRTILKHKYSGTRFDLIVSSDNDAFDFLKEYRDEVFGKIPVVFCGVNNFNREALAGTSLFTGVSETADLRESLETALTLHPSTKNIFIINDSAISGRIVRKELNRLEPVFRERVRFTYETSTDLGTILKDVETLSPDTFIFYTFFYGDPARKTYENEDCIKLISQHARVPIFGAWDFNLGYGIVGGKLTSGYDQGETAGRIGLRILKGERVGDISPILRRPGRFMFDYRQMVRFGIRKVALPLDSIVINEPESFHKVPNRVIWATVSGIAALCLLSLLLFRINRQRKRSEELLQKAHDGLEKTVAERTSDLSELNERLRKDIQERRRTEEELKRANMELIREVEARKSAEAASSQSVSLLRATIESTNDGILVVNTNGKIVDCNRRFLDMWSIPDEVISSRDDDKALDYVVDQLANPDDFIAKVKALYNNPEEESLDILRFKDGRIFERFSRPQNLNNTIVGRVWSFRDITSQKKMEEEILKSQKLESLGVLAGGIAHDFNNLLTGIVGNISLAKMSIDPENKAHARLEQAEKACSQTRGLTSQLLTFAKGGAPVKKLDSVARIILDSAGFVLRGSNVRCSYCLADDLWDVEVDSGQISQVINNLIINAAQAMPDGGVITVHAENVVVAADSNLSLPNGRYVHIRIKDQGIGIPEENLSKIFDPYFTTKPKGSGLGLASVYSIILKHEGHVSVESVLGEGTTFHLYLPAADEAFINESDQTVAGNSWKGKGSVLVVDDELMVRHTAREILEYLGYHVDLCENGTAALNLYREAKEAGRPYAFVLMDLTIPGGMGGKVAMDKLLEVDRDAKVLVTSGYSNDPILAHYRENGFAAVVMKPFTVSEIMTVLETLGL